MLSHYLRMEEKNRRISEMGRGDHRLRVASGKASESEEPVSSAYLTAEAQGYRRSPNAFRSERHYSETSAHKTKGHPCLLFLFCQFLSQHFSLLPHPD